MLTRRHLFDILRQKSGENRDVQRKHLFNYLVQYYQIEEDCEQQKLLKKDCSRFCSKINLMFDNCGRMVDRFLDNNEKWLNGTFVFKKVGDENVKEPQPSTSKGFSGRRQQSFLEIGERAKRKRASKLTEHYEAEELAFAASKSLKEEGRGSALVIKLKLFFQHLCVLKKLGLLGKADQS